MALIKEVVAGTKFPASIGLTDDQLAKGVALAKGNPIQGHPKYFATLAELQACPVGWLMPGNEGTVYADPLAAKNGKYIVAADLVTWSVYAPGSGGTVDTVNGVAPTAGTKNVSLTSDNMPEGATNTYFTEARTMASKLINYVVQGTTRALTSSDTLVMALGILENRINQLTSIIGLKTELRTTDKSTLVAAINEHDTKIRTADNDQKTLKIYKHTNFGGL